MKNYQKNWRNLFMAFACMFEQPRVAVQGNLHNWHLNKHIWSLNLNLWFKWTSTNMVVFSISPKYNIFPWHNHASYCCIALIVFLLVCWWLFPLDRHCSDDVFVDADEVQFHLQKCQASKPPWSLWYNPTLSLLLSFYCIRTTMIQLLHVAVFESIPLHDLSLPQ